MEQKAHSGAIHSPSRAGPWASSIASLGGDLTDVSPSDASFEEGTSELASNMALGGYFGPRPTYPKMDR